MEPTNPDQYDELLKQISRLAEQQDALQRELGELKTSLLRLKGQPPEVKKVEPVTPVVVKEIQQPISPKPVVSTPTTTPKVKKQKTPLEEFIGTNLLNKIGIAILVLGISYGVKYSIDHNLIDPITRVILGYVAGLALVGLAMRLKKNYKTFSAVLLSGGMASLYFITYAAYDFYALMPQALTFVLMVLFTAFTVYAALMYDQIVIAIIGLVGAYAVPFMLSDGSGRVAILFTYITIVNAGILTLGFRKAWKQLYYLAFGLTWLIFAFWYWDQYNVNLHLWTSLGFSTIFFAAFYTTFLAYKLIGGEPFSRWDIVMLLSNSFIYFGFGYDAISDHAQGELFLGLFTLFNAIMHFIACAVIFRRREATKETFYFVAGMVLVFLTMAVPVQLDGNWVTLIWAGETALMFWIGRTKSVPVFERLSYVGIFLTTASLTDDWKAYEHYVKGQPELFVRFFLNIYFFTSVWVLAAFGWMLKITFSKNHKPATEAERVVFPWIFASLSALLLYLSVYQEVATFWRQRYIDSQMTAYSDLGQAFEIFDTDLLKFQVIWLLVYSSLFGLALSLANRYVIKNAKVTAVCTGFNAFVLFLFVVTGLVVLADLRSSYLQQTDAKHFFRDYAHILIRYVAYVFILPLVWINRQHIKDAIFPPVIKQAEVVLLHTFAVVLLSSELVHWLELAGVHESFKLGLSILWGCYALMLIVFGLKNNQKLLRILAIILFSITIVKLFLYDMSEMSTIAKTIVMVILGALMLVASFLYNKVKKTTSENEQ